VRVHEVADAILQPERFRAADSTLTARLTVTGGDTLIMRGPVIVGDSLVGRQKRSGLAFDSLPRVSVPLTAVTKAELRKSDTAASVGLFLVGVAGVVTIAAVIWAASNTCIFCPAGRAQD
jgi:hypothetical protein